MPDIRSEWLAALEALNEYEKSYPGDPEILTLIGRVQWALGDKNAAIDTLWKTFKSDPTDRGSAGQLGSYLLASGRWRGYLRVMRLWVDHYSFDPHLQQRKKVQRWIK